MTRLVLFVSHSYVGVSHDFSILKTEFPPEKNWFKNFGVEVDLGFQGFEKDYICKYLRIPNKRKKNQELTDEQKKENKEISSDRIMVEHSIGGMKRYRILCDRLRMHDYRLYDEIVGVCAGLWNFSQIHIND